MVIIVIQTVCMLPGRVCYHRFYSVFPYMSNHRNCDCIQVCNPVLNRNTFIIFNGKQLKAGKLFYQYRFSQTLKWLTKYYTSSILPSHIWYFFTYLVLLGQPSSSHLPPPAFLQCKQSSRPPLIPVWHAVENTLNFV